jgi:AAA domain/DnaB-like helicase N terminal domain
MTENPMVLAEAEILAGCLQNPGKVPAVSILLSPSDFRTEVHREVFAAILAASATGGASLARLSGVVGKHPDRRMAALLPGEIARLARAKAAADLGAAALDLRRARVLEEMGARVPAVRAGDTLESLAERLSQHSQDILTVAETLQPKENLPRSISLHDALAEPQPAEPFLIDGLIGQANLAVLAADSNVGKTTLAVQLALGLAAGGLLVDGTFRSGRPRRVLYVNLEGNRYDFLNWAALTAKSLGVNLKSVELRVPTRGKFSLRIGSPALESVVHHAKPDLLVIDTFQRARVGQENSSDDWQEKNLLPLERLSREYGHSTLLLHHHGKENEFRKGADKGRGTSAMLSDAQCWLRLERASDGDPEGATLLPRKLFVDKAKGRLAGQVFSLVLDRKTATFRHPPAPVSNADIVERAVLGSSEPMTVGAVAKATRLSTTDANTALAECLRKGHMREIRGGSSAKYAPPDPQVALIPSALPALRSGP